MRDMVMSPVEKVWVATLVVLCFLSQLQLQHAPPCKCP